MHTVLSMITEWKAESPPYQRTLLPPSFLATFEPVGFQMMNTFFTRQCVKVQWL